MHIYVKKHYNPAKFHPNLIWNDEALGFLKRSRQQQEEQEQDAYWYVISSWSKIS